MVLVEECASVSETRVTDATSPRELADADCELGRSLSADGTPSMPSNGSLPSIADNGDLGANGSVDGKPQVIASRTV